MTILSPTTIHISEGVLVRWKDSNPIPKSSRDPNKDLAATRTLGIIQARMGSSRYPGKVLAPIDGVPMLLRIINRVQEAGLTWVVVATTTKPADDVIEYACEKWNVTYYRGSETDVLGRFKEVSKLIQPNTVVRITGDCPLVDPDKIREAVQFFWEHSADYVTFGNIRNPVSRFYPDGFDVEVFSAETLKYAYLHAKGEEREHVGLHMLRYLTTAFLKYESPLAEPYKLSVDTVGDLKLVEQIYRRYGEGVRIHDAEEFLKELRNEVQ